VRIVVLSVVVACSSTDDVNPDLGQAGESFDNPYGVQRVRLQQTAETTVTSP
jgi:hypothetical protein